MQQAGQGKLSAAQFSGRAGFLAQIRGIWAIWVVCVGIFAGAGVLLAGCSSDDSQDEGEGCVANEDCPDGQSCLLGMCIARESSRCYTAADCPSEAYLCVDGQCRHSGFDADGANPGADAGVPDAGGTWPGADTSAEEPADPDAAPRVIATTPADGAENVAPDTALTATFDRDMDPVSMNHFSLGVRNADGRSLSLYADYDEESRTALIYLDEPLQPAEAYRLDVRSGARDLAGVGIAPEHTSRFITTYQESEAHRELAETWAPTIYQGISKGSLDGSGQGDNRGNPNEEGEEEEENDSNNAAPQPALLPEIDIPTRVDFDGNLKARDNLAGARQAGADLPASVYYQVTESVQYYFIHYLLYYPGRYQPTDGSIAEHDFAGVVLVINKADEKLLLAETVSQGDSGQRVMAYRPESSPARSYEGDIGTLPLLAFGDEYLEDDTHFPLYIRAGEHEACNWQRSGDRGRCLHATAQFEGSNDQGVIMRPGEAQAFSQATQNQEGSAAQMTYELVPFTTEFWFIRDRYGEDELFELSYPYRPQGTDRPGDLPPEERRMLPRKLRSDADSSYGRTPFGWLASAGQNNEGQWLLDPVYMLPNRYRFFENIDTRYCFNIFFAIDRTGEEGCAP